MDDAAALESAIVEVATGHPRASSGDPRQDAWWMPLLIEAARILLPILIERCRDRSGRELKALARAVRGRHWLNFKLRRLYNDAWYAARESLAEAGAEFDPEDVYALADRVIAAAAESDEGRIEACRRAVLRA